MISTGYKTQLYGIHMREKMLKVLIYEKLLQMSKNNTIYVKMATNMNEQLEKES